eukprot:3601599-Rhodomonas_salina.1
MRHRCPYDTVTCEVPGCKTKLCAFEIKAHMRDTGLVRTRHIKLTGAALRSKYAKLAKNKSVYLKLKKEAA